MFAKASRMLPPLVDLPIGTVSLPGVGLCDPPPPPGTMASLTITVRENRRRILKNLLIELDGTPVVGPGPLTLNEDSTAGQLPFKATFTFEVAPGTHTIHVKAKDQDDNHAFENPDGESRTLTVQPPCGSQ
ncbi:MAG: hypothetical protein HYY93_11195 [Planctomycetes bacterium]|nr:hypothetical protein [Planctomycetota bacterium]